MDVKEQDNRILEQTLKGEMTQQIFETLKRYLSGIFDTKDDNFIYSDKTPLNINKLFDLPDVLPDMFTELSASVVHFNIHNDKCSVYALYDHKSQRITKMGLTEYVNKKLCFNEIINSDASLFDNIHKKIFKEYNGLYINHAFRNDDNNQIVFCGGSNLLKINVDITVRCTLKDYTVNIHELNFSFYL